jgi:hypothetical protein
MSLLCGYHWKRGIGGVKGGPKTGWRQGYFGFHLGNQFCKEIGLIDR